MRIRGDYSTNSSKAECVRAQKGLALPRASHSGEIALAGSRRLRSTLAAAPVLFAHAVVTEIEFGRIISPRANCARVCVFHVHSVLLYVCLVVIHVPALEGLGIAGLYSTLAAAQVHFASAVVSMFDFGPC